MNRIERAIKGGKKLADVFPRLTSLSSTVSGQGLQVEVTIVKKGGAPVRYVAGDDPTEAAAIRTVHLQRKYRYSVKDLAGQVQLTLHQLYAVREHLGLDDDDACQYTFEFGSQKHKQYSDEAIKRSRAFLNTGKLDEAVKAYNAKQPKRGSRAKR